MRASDVAVACVGLLLMAPAIGRAHHGFAAEFDAEKPVELHGVVTKVEWVNPHVWISLDVTEGGGKVSPWEVEGGAPNSLFRRGFRINSLAIGSAVVVRGFASRDGRSVVNGRDITFADGRKLFMGSLGAGDPNADVPGK